MGVKQWKKDLRTAFLIEAINCSDWDDPVITEDLEERRKFYEEIGMDIRMMREL